MSAGPDDATPDLVRLIALVHGHVQDVGYRAYCVRAAALIGREGGARLTGYARNLPSGVTVELVVEGPRSLLERLLERLEAGPGMARVVRVEHSWSAASREFEGFATR